METYEIFTNPNQSGSLSNGKVVDNVHSPKLQNRSLKKGWNKMLCQENDKINDPFFDEIKELQIISRDNEIREQFIKWNKKDHGM